MMLRVRLESRDDAGWFGRGTSRSFLNPIQGSVYPFFFPFPFFLFYGEEATPPPSQILVFGSNGEATCESE